MQAHVTRTSQLTCRALGVILAVLTAAVLLATSAFASATMTLTFVRHGESQANYDGIINTRVPGPDLTPTGVDQAWAVAYALEANDYDGVYASTMIRTRQTAAPLAGLLGEDIVVLDGLREIDAGIVEGSSEDTGLGRIGYALPPALWTLGARFVPMLGSTDRNGNFFDDRVDTAVQMIYDSGDRNAVAFAHGATIMFWVLMNVDNPDLGLLLTRRLDNTSTVEIAGSPEDGWTLVNWDGVAVDAEPSFFTKLFVDFRDWITVPQTGLHNVGKAVRTGNIGTVVRAIGQGLIDVVVATVRLGASIVGDVVGLVRDVFTGSPAQPAVVERSRNRVSATMTQPSAEPMAASSDDPVADAADEADDAIQAQSATLTDRSDEPDAPDAVVTPESTIAVTDPAADLSSVEAADESDDKSDVAATEQIEKATIDGSDGSAPISQLSQAAEAPVTPVTAVDDGDQAGDPAGKPGTDNAGQRATTDTVREAA